MKKIFTIILLSALSLIAVAQQKKVAVYLTGEQTTISKVLGDELVKAFAKSGKYAAIERTKYFLAELEKEQTYQRSGAVDDKVIARLGIQFGVNYVCVAEMSDFFEEKYISSRLIDVETAEVVNLHNVHGLLNSPDACMKMASEIATNLSKGSFVEQQQEAKKKEEEEMRIKNEEEKRRQQEELQRKKQEEEKKNDAIRKQYNAGYIKLGSFYVTKTLTSSRYYENVKSWPQKCLIGDWNDWRFPTKEEARWIRHCFDESSSFEDVQRFLVLNAREHWEQKLDYMQRCMWLNNGLFDSEPMGGCDGVINVILVRGYK